MNGREKEGRSPCGWPPLQGNSCEPQRLVGGLGFRSYIDTAAFTVEEYAAVHQGENGVVTAHAHALAGVPLGAALADDDVARDYFLAAEFFHAEALAAGVATVLDRTLTFLVSHKIKMKLEVEIRL